MIFFVSSFLIGVGIASLFFRATLLGAFIGVQVLFYGVTLLIASLGFALRLKAHGHLLGVFILFISVSIFVVGYSLAVRLFYLRKETKLSALNLLKH